MGTSYEMHSTVPLSAPIEEGSYSYLCYDGTNFCIQKLCWNRKAR